jgi:sugar phosphate isomerase/epimerase
MDTGHLLEQGQSPAAFMSRHGGRVGEIHLHGLDREKAAIDGRLPDHRAIRVGDPWLEELLPALKTFPGVVNLEVFSWEEAAQSVQAFRQMGAR